MSQIRHPNIVNFFGASTISATSASHHNNIQEGTPLLIMELCSGGSFMSALQRPARGEGPALPWSVRLQVLHEVTQAVLYLHSRMPAVVHKDLKSANVLLDASNHAKLTVSANNE
jgi:serine/threonine protein kinase